MDACCFCPVFCSLSGLGALLQIWMGGPLVLARERDFGDCRLVDPGDHSC